MEERSDNSFRFMEELVATWLEGAHHTEISRLLEVIKAELRRRGLAHLVTVLISTTVLSLVTLPAHAADWTAWLQQVDSARRALEQAQEAVAELILSGRRAPASRPARPDVLTALETYAALLRQLGRASDAAVVTHHAHRLREALSGSGRAMPGARPPAPSRDTDGSEEPRAGNA